MKKAIVLFLGLLVCAAAVSAEGTPVISKGTWGAFAETDNVTVSALGVEYFVIDKLAVGAGLFFSWTDQNDPQTDTRFVLAPQVAYHFLQKGSLSVYGGGFVRYDHLCNLDTTIDWQRIIRELQVGGMVGVDWFFLPSASLGMRYRVFWQLDSISVRTGGTTTSASDGYLYASAYPEFVLTVYFK